MDLETIISFHEFGNTYDSDNFLILKKLEQENKFKEIKIIAKIGNTEKIYWDFFIIFALKTNDLIYLNHLVNDEKFLNLGYRISNLYNYITLENAKIIFYPEGKITERTIKILADNRSLFLTYRDLFDQFLTYSPTPKDMSIIIRRSLKIDINNWVKICNNYGECFDLIPNHVLNYTNIEELYLNLIAIGRGNKIYPLGYIKTEIVLNNWIYFDMDNYYSDCINIVGIKILSKSPKTVYNICNNIINSCSEIDCFKSHRFDLMTVFRDMCETNKTIFENLVKKSNFDAYHKKYLLDRADGF